MKVCCFPYCAFLGFITTYASTVVNSNGEDVISETFKTKGSTRILQTDKTTDVYSKSIISCADICLSDPQCCVASYSKGTSTCRTDTSERCAVDTEPLEGWRFIQRNSYPTMTCTGCISFDNSLYRISEDQLDWTKAKKNCEHLGGKLAELETSEENEFIKNEVRTRNTGVYGYWIGGYDFHNDNDMEWASQPDQSMSFRDFHQGEPGGLLNQLCMVMWWNYDFRWGDYHCYASLSYICEFTHR